MLKRRRFYYRFSTFTFSLCVFYLYIYKAAHKSFELCDNSSENVCYLFSAFCRNNSRAYFLLCNFIVMFDGIYFWWIDSKCIKIYFYTFYESFALIHFSRPLYLYVSIENECNFMGNNSTWRRETALFLLMNVSFVYIYHTSTRSIPYIFTVNNIGYIIHHHKFILRRN